MAGAFIRRRGRHVVEGGKQPPAGGVIVTRMGRDLFPANPAPYPDPYL
jgi:hypothetical protein